METRAGVGTSFKIKLPFTLALTEALLVKVGDEVFAIPYTSIEGVTRVPSQELLACYRGEQAIIQYAGRDYRPKYLGEILELTPCGKDAIDEQKKWLPCLLVRHGEHGIAIQVDQMLGSRQIVVKPVGVQISTIRWVTGGTILGDGRVALILDISALVRLSEIHQLRMQKESESDRASAPVAGAGEIRSITVMVVDDSITVRKVTGRLLNRHNMKPRMEGYELTRHIRHTLELKGIPIIMITSRSGEKHRLHALELGVDTYLGKPYQEAELLEHIYALLAEKNA
jgi:chemosensory pili system protein ChpA (sensor histidine kinase/response regulator)